MNTDNISEEIPLEEFYNDKKENNSFSFAVDAKENYNELYSNFNVKERKNDFWDIINNKADYKNEKTNKLNNIHHLLNYKNYQMIDNNDFSFENKNYNNSEEIDYNLKFYSSKNKKGRNRKISNCLQKQSSMNSQLKKEHLTYELDSIKYKVYNRLYNRGFYIKNKIIINKIKDEESFSNTISSHSFVNPKSKKILLFKNHSINLKKNNFNRSDNYFNKEQTFKPNIDKNSIRIVNRLQKNQRYFKFIKSTYEKFFNNDEKKIDKINYDILKDNNKDIYNNFHKSKYSNYNINKSLSQRTLDLHYKNIELYKTKDIESEKNNEQNDENKKTKIKINNYNIYEKNKKWRQLRDEKIKLEKEKRENLEIYENKKELFLPGNENYEKYKNLIIKIYSPKKKENTYSSMLKKNITHINKLVNNNNKNEIKMNKNNSNSKDKVVITNNYHRQIWKYINNDGKELFLFNPYFNENNIENEIQKKNNINFSEFTKIVKENPIEINKIKDKTKSKNNKIIKNKNSLEYKMKNIINTLGNNKIKKC